MNAIIRREPLSSFFDDVFADYVTRAGWPVAARGNGAPASVLARTDVIDRGDKYSITVDLPGVRKDDIRVTVEGARVAIAAETKASTETKDGDKVLHAERRATSYARSLELPVDVTDENADASFENGVLHLTLPKRVHVASRRLTVR
jgi:HSP20 family protein